MKVNSRVAGAPKSVAIPKGNFAPKSKANKSRFRALPVLEARRRWQLRLTARYDFLFVFHSNHRSRYRTVVELAVSQRNRNLTEEEEEEERHVLCMEQFSLCYTAG